MFTDHHGINWTSITQRYRESIRIWELNSIPLITNESKEEIKGKLESSKKNENNQNL